jgi:hypothetical protein
VKKGGTDMKGERQRTQSGMEVNLHFCGADTVDSQLLGGGRQLGFLSRIFWRCSVDGHPGKRHCSV